MVDETFDTDGARTANFAATVQTAAERYRVVVTLGSSVSSASPVLKRVTLRTVPSPFVAQSISLPLFLADNVASDGRGTDYGMDTWVEFQFLQALLVSRERFSLQVGSWTGDVRMEGLEVQPGGLGGGNGLEKWNDRGTWFSGRWNITCVTLQPEETV